MALLPGDTTRPLRVQAFASPDDALRSTLRQLATELGMRTTFVSRVDAGGNGFEVIAAYNAPGGSEVWEGEDPPLSRRY